MQYAQMGAWFWEIFCAKCRRVPAPGNKVDRSEKFNLVKFDFSPKFVYTINRIKLTPRPWIRVLATFGEAKGRLQRNTTNQ